MLEGLPPTSNPQTLLGFDLGLARTGVAVGNTLLKQAKPLATFQARNKAARLTAAAQYIAQWQPQALVLGLPRHPDGTAHDMTRAAMNYAKALFAASSLPLYLVDERYSSAIAGVETDADAAAVILQQFFDEGGTLYVPPTITTITTITETITEGEAEGEGEGEAITETAPVLTMLAPSPTPDCEHPNIKPNTP